MNLQSYTNDKTPLQLPACSVIFVLHNAQYEVERRLSPFFSEQLNAELIIIDDASEDGTDNAITSLLEHYEYEPTIYLRNQTRRGIGLCLNDALMQANTPLLYIVDVSVEIDIEAMRRALALLEHSDAAFCVPSGSKYSDFETLRHHLFEQKVPASAAFLLHTERISSEQLFFNPFIKEGHAADLCLRTAAGLPPLEVAPFITGLGGAAGFELSKQLLINLSQQEASVMRFHAANAPVLAQNGTSDAASEDPALLYKRARSLKLDGRITDALHLCDDILYQYPGHDDTEELKIELLQRIKQFVGASELKHQRNMKRREQARQATSPDPDEEPVPEATSPAEPPLSAAEAPEPQEAGTLSPEPAPDDDASEDTTAAQPTAPEPETEEPVEASASHDADDVNNEILDDDDDEILIDPRFLPDTDFFDEEEVKEQAAPDHIAPPPAENTFEVAGNTAALPEEPETESPAEAESGPTESTEAGPAVQEEPAGSPEQTVPEKPAAPAVPEPSENMPEPEKKDPEANTPEPQEAGTLSPEPPAEDAASEDTTAAAEAEETREPAEMPEHPPQDAEESAAAATTSDTSAEAAETADSSPEAELSEPPEKEAENEPETSDAPSAAETEEATLKARQEDARGPYKRPMSFYYTIVMPIAGIALEMLEECLLSLEQNCDPDKTELIIIDNACLDETHEYLKQLSSHKFFHLHVITNRTNQGFGRSVNQGIDKALGEYICVMHNDVSLESDLLFELSEILNQHPKVGLVGPK
ncbi:MAG: glycosyltransferase, partial [Cyclonatronaceae bacterium]